jgi:CubicO group peptidase (beta-lactamase class C family)
MPEFRAAYAPGTHDRFREHLKLLKDYPIAFAPGTGDFYANINFSIPAFTIESVTGMPYAEYMRQEVFAPLGMDTAVVDDEGVVIPNRVQGYNIIDGQRVPVEKSRDWMLGGGDIVGRVEDVYCLNKAVKHRLLLREETWEDVLTPSPINNKGMGCTITQWHGKKRITHNGGHRGFRTLHVYLPEDDFDIIWLSNSGYGDARKQISELVYDAFYGADSCESEAVEMDKGYI